MIILVGILLPLRINVILVDCSTHSVHPDAEVSPYSGHLTDYLCHNYRIGNGIRP